LANESWSANDPTGRRNSSDFARTERTQLESAKGGRQVTFGSLFSGIGGLDLGLERAGMRCAWQCELDDYARRVLAKHWPNVRRHDDVRTFPPEGEWHVDLIAGGFPCQDLSLAGRREGLEGERSGLWWEFARVIRVLRPRYVLVENVPGLLAPPDGGKQAPMGCVLGELARLGYDAEWQSIPASAFGSTQLRFRVFVIAYPQGYRSGSRVLPARWGQEGQGEGDIVGGGERVDADNVGERVRVRGCSKDASASGGVQDQECEREWLWSNAGAISGSDELQSDNADSQRSLGGQGAAKVCDQSRKRRPPGEPGRRDSPFVGSGWWGVEPEVVRMVHGLPRRLVRPAIRGLGNAVIPQAAEWIGKRILECEQ